MLLTQKRNAPKTNIVDQANEQPVKSQDIPTFIKNLFTNIGPDLAKKF